MTAPSDRHPHPIEETPVPTRFRKRPVEVEAVQWTGGAVAAGPVIDWVLSGGGTARWEEERFTDVSQDATGKVFTHARQHPVPERISIDTLEGVMRASVGDWIVRGPFGEHYPVKPEIFTATYEAVTL